MTPGPLAERIPHPHYEILEQCGQGGMGVVYKARDKRLNRVVALKFLLPARADSGDDLKRFQREAESIAALNHPNIATLYEIGEWSGQPFLAMEYLPGGSLSARASGIAATYEQLCRYAAELGGGLQFAHAKGILHRDIKPANAMFSGQGALKLVDFGIAKARSSEEITQTGVSMGTIGYMAPELLRGEGATVRTDIYAFGAMLYELAAGHRMFPARSLGTLIDQIMRSPPEPLRSLRPDLPMRFCEAVARATAAESASRFASLDEFLDALELPSSVGLATRTLTVERITSAKNTRRRKLLWASCAVLGALGIGAAVEYVMSHGTPAEQVVVVLPFTNIGADAANQALCDGLTEIVTGLISMAAGSHNLLVVPSDEVRRDNVQTIPEARRQFKATLALTGTAQKSVDRLRLTLALDDAVKLRQKDTRIIAVATSETAELQDRLAEAISSLFGYRALAPSVVKPPGQTTSSSTAYELYLRGTGAVENRDANAAIGFLQKALGEDAAFALARAKLAEAFMWKSSFTKDPSWLQLADAEVSRAAQGGAGHETLLAKAMIRKATGDSDTAIGLFRQLLQNEPSNMEAYQLLAQTLASANRPAEAEETLRRAIRLRPGYWPLHNTLGVIYMNRDDYARAEQELSAAAALAPNSAVVYSNLGVLYFSMNRWSEAAADFEKALSFGPHALAEANLGTVYFYQGNYEAAAKHALISTRMQPSNAVNWGNLGDDRWQIPGQKKAALEAFEEAARLAGEQLAINPSDFSLRRSYALYLAMLGRTKEASTQIGMALAQAPKNKSVQFYAARVFMALGETRLASAALERCKALGYSKDVIAREPDLAAINKQ